MAVYAQAEDVAAFFGTLTEDQVARVDRMLSYAALLVDQAVPTVPARLAAETLSLELVRDVVANIVVRALRNPDGAKSSTKSQTIGPASVSQSTTFDDRVPLGGLIVTAEDVRVLSPAPLRTSAPVGSIRLSPGL